MKKKNLSGLSLNKKTISNLQSEKLVGGHFTEGFKCLYLTAGSINCPLYPTKANAGKDCNQQ